MPVLAATRSTRLIRLGAILLVLTTAVTLAAGPFYAASTPRIGGLNVPDDFFGAIMALVYSSVGFLIVRFQPRQAIGWLFMALAVPLAVASLAQAYAVYVLFAAPGAGLPGLAAAAWLQRWLVFLGFPIPFTILFMLFPTGRLPAPGWRWLLAIAFGILALQVILNMFSPDMIWIYIANREFGPIRNPVGIEALSSFTRVMDLTWLAGMLVLLSGGISLLLRYRNAALAERQQLKWLVFFLMLLLILLPFSFGGGDTVVDDLALMLMILMLPAGTAIAVLRYKLYGIDVIIRRTVQYTLLTGILAAFYLGLVLIFQNVFTGLNEDLPPFVLVVSTLATAALFNPLRLRILAFIDRRFFRSKYDTEKILSQFAGAVRSEVDIDQLIRVMVGTIEATLQPEKVSLWVSAGARPRPARPAETLLRDGSRNVWRR